MIFLPLRRSVGVAIADPATIREHDRQHHYDQQEIIFHPVAAAAYHKPAFRVMYHDDAGDEYGNGNDARDFQVAVDQ